MIRSWNVINSKEALKCCPFCGSEAELLVDDSREAGDITHLAKIRCKDRWGCGANILGSLSYYKIVKQWNRGK